MSPPPRDPANLTITFHALGRYQERVAPVSRAEAAAALRAHYASGRINSRPRWWMDGAFAGENVCFGLNWRWPDVALVLRRTENGHVVVTVLTRDRRRGSMFAERQPKPRAGQGGRRRRPRARVPDLVEVA